MMTEKNTTATQSCKEASSNKPSLYNHGEIISLQQFTDLILSQSVDKISALKLFTLSYDMPPNEGNARAIHRHLLSLSDQGVSIMVAVDNTYGRRVAPKSDLPRPIARLRGEGKVIEDVKKTQAELQQHKNIHLVFNGSENPPVFPLSKIDHRKLLLVYDKNGNPDAAVIFGSSVNYHFDSDESIGSSIYLSDPAVLRWLDEYSKTPHYTAPTQINTGAITITTRELVKGGNELADREITSLIDSARNSLIFSAQWVPDGKIFEAISKAAARGVNISVYSNFPPIKREPLYSPIRKKAVHQLSRIARKTGNLHFFIPCNPSLFIHLNALIADTDSPTHAKAITGTDNMSNELMMKLGMRETLLTLNDPLMVKKFIDYVKTHLIPRVKEYRFDAASSSERILPRDHKLF